MPPKRPAQKRPPTSPTAAGAQWRRTRRPLPSDLWIPARAEAPGWNEVRQPEVETRPSRPCRKFLHPQNNKNKKSRIYLLISQTPLDGLLLAGLWHSITGRKKNI
jgi:hypothetical protein